MSAPHRLNALENAFLQLDSRGSPFRVGAVLQFERGPLTTPSGDLDVARLRQYFAALLDRLPEYRQRIRRIPLLGHPVWVDVDPFDIDHHVKLTRVAAPGSAAELHESVSRIICSPLPHSRPPWQIWFVDGLAGDRFAMVTVVHHALVDGVAGVRLLEAMLRGVPDAIIPARTPSPPQRTRAPALLAAELIHRARGLLALRDRLGDSPRQLLPALAEMIARGLRPASNAGLNRRRVSPDRLVTTWQMPLDEIKRVRRHFDATVNDVLLTVASGALHRFLARRGVDVARLADFRALVPASTHLASDRAVSGNRISMLLTQLPVDEADPDRRIARVRATTRALKRTSRQAAAGEFLTGLSDVTAPSLMPALLGLLLSRRAFNIVITDIPGPPFPLYLLGCRLDSFHPIINLWPGHTLGLAFFSYAGTLYCGLHADREAIPELDGLSADLEASFAELRAAVPAPAPVPVPEPARIPAVA